MTSILPGSLVQSLVTAVLPSGLNLQILGFFEGTVDQIHLPPNETYKTGQKIKARILYNVAGTTPPRFSLALVDHVMALDVKYVTHEGSKNSVSLRDAYPVGLVLDSIKVNSVESERGLSVEISPGVEGFVHVSTHKQIDRLTSNGVHLRFHKHLMNMSLPFRRRQGLGRLAPYTGLVLPGISHSTACYRYLSDNLFLTNIILKSPMFTSAK